MTIALNEDCVGIDDDILFVNIQSCMALIVTCHDGRMGGMHMTQGTTPKELADAAKILGPQLEPINRLVCIGNTDEFATTAGRDPAMLFPGKLGAALPTAFLEWYGGTDPVYYSTSGFFKSTAGSNPRGGVVVHAWRDARSSQIQYAFGDHRACAPAGSATGTQKVFKINTNLPATDITSWQQAYTLDGTKMQLILPQGFKPF